MSKLNSLQKQLSETKETIASKLAKTASLLPTRKDNQNGDASSYRSQQKRPSNTAQISPATTQKRTTSIHNSPRSCRKRPSGADDIQSNGERIKRRRIIEAIESAPTSSGASTSKSPDVAVSLL